MTFDFVATGKLIQFPQVPGASLCKEATAIGGHRMQFADCVSSNFQ